MKLIADSGSSKTDWRWFDEDGAIYQGKTIGLNPYYIDTASIITELRQNLIPLINSKISEIHFYGAGCANAEKNAVIEAALRHLFGAVNIAVDNDLLAAARALCEHRPGIACILGTGANSCAYDGHDITTNLRAFGYILGDEGSGAYLGKSLISNYLRGNLPADLKEKFNQRFNTGVDEILDRVYHQPFPNRYLGSFTKFMFDHQKHPFIYQLIYQAFALFFERYIVRYKGYQALPVHFVGSIAFYFSNILRQVANDQGISVKNIMESPIAGLTLYHQKKH